MPAIATVFAALLHRMMDSLSHRAGRVNGHVYIKSGAMYRPTVITAFPTLYAVCSAEPT
jgi:hypothetical protein